MPQMCSWMTWATKEKEYMTFSGKQQNWVKIKITSLKNWTRNTYSCFSHVLTFYVVVYSYEVVVKCLWNLGLGTLKFKIPYQSQRKKEPTFFKNEIWLDLKTKAESCI